MTRKALIEREAKRTYLVKKFSKKRSELLTQLKDPALDFQQRMLARKLLEAIPRNAAPTRQRRRCILTGRPRGVWRQFGLCRHKLREYAMQGWVPGLTKASW